jgi:nucleoside 2-deoxyribosyltransferase
MKVYLAARFARKDEMQGVRDVLEALGDTVVSRWIDSDEPYDLTNATLDTEPERGRKYAEDDLEDMQAADAILYFSQGGPGNGGRFVEWGYCYALGKRMIMVGPRENVFFTLPFIEWYPDWVHLLAQWSGDFLDEIGVMLGE